MRKWVPDVIAWSVVLIVCYIVGVRPILESNVSGDRQASFTEGPELLAILITSSTCSVANDDGFRDIYDLAIHKLRSDAIMHGKRFATLGVAVDWNVADGLQALAGFGSFDEIATGRRWLNSTVVGFLSPMVGGTQVVPQLIVVSREVVKRGEQVETTADSVIVHLIGPDAIVAWERDGVPLAWEAST